MTQGEFMVTDNLWYKKEEDDRHVVTTIYTDDTQSLNEGTGRG